jgi:hypothetical protein
MNSIRILFHDKLTDFWLYLGRKCLGQAQQHRARLDKAITSELITRPSNEGDHSDLAH